MGHVRLTPNTPSSCCWPGALCRRSPWHPVVPLSGRRDDRPARQPTGNLESRSPLSDTPTAAPADAPMGTFDAEGVYHPRQVTADDLSVSFADAVDRTMVDVEDGQIVQGTVVKVDKD